MFSSVLEQFSFTPKFLGKNAKIDFFKRKNGSERIFLKQLKCRWLQTCQQTIEILLMVDFLRIFKNIASFNCFRDF